MSRDLSADIDRLTSQLADLRRALSKQASVSAEDASGYLVPRARQVARQFRHGGHDLTEVVRRNPGTTTGAVIGALALTAAFAFLLSKSGSDRG